MGMSVGRGHETRKGTTSEKKKSRGREGSRTFMMTEKEAAGGRTAQRWLLGDRDQLKQMIFCMAT